VVLERFDQLEVQTVFHSWPHCAFRAYLLEPLSAAVALLQPEKLAYWEVLEEKESLEVADRVRACLNAQDLGLGLSYQSWRFAVEADSIGSVTWLEPLELVPLQDVQVDGHVEEGGGGGVGVGEERLG